VAFRGYRLTERLTLFPGGGVLVDNDTLVIADLHLGCEAALESEGISIPRVQTRKIIECVDGLLAASVPRRLVIAGDLKHNFSRNLVQEWQDVAKFVDRIAGNTEVSVVRGNHDNYLGMILSQHGIPFRQEADLGETQVVHGHKRSGRDCGIVMGHIHPSISLGKGLSGKVKTPCFLYHEGSDILVLPALSLVAGGIDVLRQDVRAGISPIASDVGMGGFRPLVFTETRVLRFPTIEKMREKEGV